MIATTIINSIRVKPFCIERRMNSSWMKTMCNEGPMQTKRVLRRKSYPRINLWVTKFGRKARNQR
jgi:hypothetical protein